jgi:hypothetical protein
MELLEFLRQTQAEVRGEIGERMSASGSAYPYPETVFSEIVMKHMNEVGMTYDEPVACHFERTVGNANLRLSGYSISSDADQLDLFVSLYAGVDELTSIQDSEAKNAAERCLHFLSRCVDGRLLKSLDESDDAYPLVLTVKESYDRLEQIRIYVLTDQVAKSKQFKPREVAGKTIKLEVMDIERLHRHWSEGKPRDEIVVNFRDVCGDALPCVYMKGNDQEYDYALTALPGEALRFIYERYGGRLLEENVRSFLSASGKVNKGIRDTLKSDPSRFMAYNNGIVVVADEIELGASSDGSPGILWLKGLQIVNGGQTTASIYFTKRREPDLDLSRVRVATKVIVIHNAALEDEESLISDISRYANSQNAVRLSDLSANKPYHVAIERLAMTTFCPDGVGRWFYERAAGSYNTMLAREGTTPARLRQLKESIPAARKITKTDLAKFLNAWDQRPDIVSLGAQKNFEHFMKMLSESEPVLPDVPEYKRMVAKAILFKRAQSAIRSGFPAFQANITAYTIAMLSRELGRLNLDRIWERQDISQELRQQILTWADEVNRELTLTASGRMISEWAKRPECWKALSAVSYSTASTGTPEMAA